MAPKISQERPKMASWTHDFWDPENSRWFSQFWLCFGAFFGGIFSIISASILESFSGSLFCNFRAGSELMFGASKNRSEKQSLSAMGFWSTPRSNLGGLLGVLGALVEDWRAILAQPYSSFCIFGKGSQVTTLAYLGSGCRASWTKKMPERPQKGSQKSEKNGPGNMSVFSDIRNRFLISFGLNFGGQNWLKTWLKSRIFLDQF